MFLHVNDGLVPYDFDFLILNLDAQLLMSKVQVTVVWQQRWIKQLLYGAVCKNSWIDRDKYFDKEKFMSYFLNLWFV